MKYSFISDCHLSADRPEVIEYFVQFCTSLHHHTDQLFILGDLFDLWTGVEYSLEKYHRIIQSLKLLSDKIPVFFLRGNRDFLVDKQFAAQSGCQILPDIYVGEFDKQSILLMHGDLLCTQDRSYQRYRKVIRHPLSCRLITTVSPGLRKWIGHKMRSYSHRSIKNKTVTEMDADQAAVERYMTQYQVNCLIHGHTHRPNIHHFACNGQQKQRIVLGDWYSDGSVLEWEQGKPTLRKLNIQSP